MGDKCFIRMTFKKYQKNYKKRLTMLYNRVIIVYDL